MQFLQDIITQVGEFFKGFGEGFENIIQAIVDFVNKILAKEANF